jgi:phosphonate transport system substrate-binding protein
MFSATRSRPPVCTAMLAAVMITACTSDDAEPRPVAPVLQTTIRRRELPTHQRPLRVALAAALVSERGVPVYQRLIGYLEGKLGRDLELVTGLGYDAISGMLNDGAIDVAFIGVLPYVLLRDRPGMDVELLAAPVMMGARYQDKPLYYADLIVHKDSDIRSIHELRGRTYVYNEETSHAGYSLPRARLLELGLTQGFFGKVLRSGSHEESIRMVADGRADASFVTSLVLEYELAHGAGAAERVRVIESLGPTRTPPVIARSSLPEGVRQALQRHLLAMHDDPEGRSILDQALIKRFVRVDDSNYDDVRARKSSADAAGFHLLK